jgi:hypothetical protein
MFIICTILHDTTYMNNIYTLVSVKYSSYNMSRNTLLYYYFCTYHCYKLSPYIVDYNAIFTK